jgi:hypothetical protein
VENGSAFVMVDLGEALRNRGVLDGFAILRFNYASYSSD